ncbi:MAG: HAD-IIA family hydrolase [Acidimicrobiales bacterium]
MTVWAFDLDGVVWLAGNDIPGAPEAIAGLRAAGHEVCFATNFSFAPVAEAEQKLARIGVDGAGRVITSAMAAASLVAANETALVVGGPGIDEALLARGAGVVRDGDGPVDVVVVGYDPEFDYAKLTRATAAIRAGARFVATNEDPTFPTPQGLLPGGGSLVAAVAYASGVQPVVAGKPHQPFADLVRDRYGAEGIMVGDQPMTDGRLAVRLGYRFGLVLTGVTGRGDLPVEPVPDLVADDLAALVEIANSSKH